MDSLIESKLFFPILFITIYFPVSLIYCVFSGFYKKGWNRMKKEIARDIAFAIYFILGYVIIRFLYPVLPDYWKLVGTGFVYLAMVIPAVILITGISDKIYEDRKHDLIRLGWRETVEGDYKDWEEYLWNHSYAYYHPEHGIHSVTKAEKIENDKAKNMIR
jgi:hypothetical protein